MTVTLKLSPEVEQGLLAQAKARGLSLSEYLQEIATSASLHPDKEAGEPLPARTSATAAEKASAFVQWAKGHRYTQPLSDEAISRASLYPDRW